MARENEVPLVAIDMQAIFASPESEWGTTGYEDASSNVARLDRDMPGPTIWTRFVRDPREEGSWKDYYRRWSTCRLEGDSPEWELTLPIREGDAVITRPTFSKWDDELARLTEGSSRLVVCGVATDCCILATVLAAVDAGRAVTIATDACAGATPEAHDQALALMDLLSPMVTLATTDETLRAVA